MSKMDFSRKHYLQYKSRNNAETLFDGMKNNLHADKTYKKNEEAINGWMFLNNTALQFYYLFC